MFLDNVLTLLVFEKHILQGNLCAGYGFAIEYMAQN